MDKLIFIVKIIFIIRISKLLIYRIALNFLVVFFFRFLKNIFLQIQLEDDNRKSKSYSEELLLL